MPAFCVPVRLSQLLHEGLHTECVSCTLGPCSECLLLHTICGTGPTFPQYGMSTLCDRIAESVSGRRISGTHACPALAVYQRLHHRPHNQLVSDGRKRLLRINRGGEGERGGEVRAECYKQPLHTSRRVDGQMGRRMVGWVRCDAIQQPVSSGLSSLAAAAQVTFYTLDLPWFQ